MTGNFNTNLEFLKFYKKLLIFFLNLYKHFVRSPYMIFCASLLTDNFIFVYSKKNHNHKIKNPGLPGLHFHPALCIQILATRQVLGTGCVYKQIFIKYLGLCFTFKYTGLPLKGQCWALKPPAQPF